MAENPKISFYIIKYFILLTDIYIINKYTNIMNFFKRFVLKQSFLVLFLS